MPARIAVLMVVFGRDKPHPYKGNKHKLVLVGEITCAAYQMHACAFFLDLAKNLSFLKWKLARGL